MPVEFKCPHGELYHENYRGVIMLVNSVLRQMLYEKEFYFGSLLLSLFMF